MKMCSAFAHNSHIVTLFAPSVTEENNAILQTPYEFYDVAENFKIIRVLKPDIPFGGYYYALMVLLKLFRMKIDLIFSRNLLISLLASFRNVPQMLELHQPITNGSRLQRKWFNSFIQKKIFKRLIVITKPLKEIFSQEYQVPLKQIIVASDGADLSPNIAIGGQQKHKQLQVGYLGHLYEGRGVELILDLAQKCPWADFHIVGGTEDDIIRVRGIAENILNVIIHGFITPAKASLFRLEMDVLLAPYQRKVGLATGSLTTEKWMSPLKVFEYMAAGKAMISSDIEVLREVLDSGRNCLLCPPEDLSSWVNALTELNEDETLRMRLAESALTDIKFRYSWKVRAGRILQELDHD